MTDALLNQHLGRLQLPYFVQHAPALMAQAARESWPHGRFLEQLVAGEVARRDEALISRRIKEDQSGAGAAFVPSRLRPQP